MATIEIVVDDDVVIEKVKAADNVVVVGKVRNYGNTGTKPAEMEAKVPLEIRWCRGGYGGLVELFERAEYGGGGGVAEDETEAKVSESEMEMQVIVRREVKIRVVGLWKGSVK
ncbi:hypothetical protein PIB30_012035 [Stylosanthes scabra]|uniref:Uncharacterized protein n=1 Tax=Stylosanthes scabra TaxID=79078 RepID=A0ABU6Z527_9FABA|nr:hypothetical protein [Stylosanthes scabra]